MARLLMTGLVFSAAIALQACQNETPPETETPVTAEETPVEPPTPDDGKIALETADSLEQYQELVRNREGQLCNWSRKNGQPVPVFYRQQYLDAYFKDLNDLSQTDETEAQARFEALTAEFEDCLRLQIPPSIQDTAPFEAPDFSTLALFDVTGRYEGMPENMFRLVERYAHPIRFVCPIQTESGSRVLVAYDTSIETLWSDDVKGTLEEQIGALFPDMGLSTAPWSLTETSEDEMMACIAAFTAATAE